MKKILPSLLLLSATTACVAEKQVKPNILIILADDAGYADFGFMGSTDTKTPNLDKLASGGTFFTDAHVAATVSSPSRAMLMTGRFGQRFGYECNTSGRGNGLPAGEKIIPQILKEEGYRTALIGKWHLGDLPAQHPNKKGYDEFYGLIGGSRNYYYDSEKDDNPKNLHRHYQYNGEPQAFDGYFTDELTQRAKQIISESDQPFMMYLSYTAPHTPNQGKKEDMELFEGAPRQTYAAMLYALDRGIGEVVEELKRTGKYDNTIIFFLSDNGGPYTNGACNLPLKGFKGNKFEGGHRVPFIATWGDRFKAENPFQGLTSSLDIFATIVDVLGIEEEKLNKPLDGVSLIPYLTESKKGDPHQVLYWRKMDSRSIRKEDYKLIVTEGVDTVMYNLAADLAEMENLLEAEPKKAEELMKELARWEEQECIEPMWIEDGWAPITNGIHRQLMNNEIKTTDDFNKSRKRK